MCGGHRKKCQGAAVIDTGASITTLTPTAAQRLDIRYDQAQSITLATAGGLVSAPLIAVPEFAVGDARVERLQVGILPLSGSDAFDGLLGMNFCSNLPVRSISKKRCVALG